MEVIEQLIDSLQPAQVHDVLVGSFNTVVHTSGCGLASTIRPPMTQQDGLSNGGNLIGMDLLELAQYALSDNLLNASLGIAAINSAVDSANLPMKTINARELILEKGKGRTLAVIGHFPFIDQIRANFGHTMVFEQAPQGDDLPASDIPARLAEADIIAITATTLINHTFDDIMAARRPDSYCVLLGPSTPMSPILFRNGINAIGGTLVQDMNCVFRMASQGVPYRKLRGISHVTVLKEDMN